MEALLAVGCASGLSFGFCLALWVSQMRHDARQQRLLRHAIAGGTGEYSLVKTEVSGLPAAVLVLVQRESRTQRSARGRRFLDSRLLGLGLGDPGRLIAQAGLADVATSQGLRAARIRAVVLGMFGGVLAGIALSPELAAVLAAGGTIAGYVCVPAALRAEAAARNADMERHLSEMVEVVVLGLRSGLSFEQAFCLYPRYFDTGLGRAMLRASGQWGMGLVSRESALRGLEAEYDSPLLSRVVGSMVRSLRFGTSIADSLEAAAVEAREVHRARMEEKVAKVAVKMMLPVGTLILPAMLLLVMGPVMLELVQGF